jgi:hypothetical protein
MDLAREREKKRQPLTSVFDVSSIPLLFCYLDHIHIYNWNESCFMSHELMMHEHRQCWTIA